MSNTTTGSGRIVTHFTWGARDNLMKFSTEASELGMEVGFPPWKQHLLDPWHRPLPHLEQVWTTMRDQEGEVTGWRTTVRAPDGVPVVLTIYND